MSTRKSMPGLSDSVIYAAPNELPNKTLSTVTARDFPAKSVIDERDPLSLSPCGKRRWEHSLHGFRGTAHSCSSHQRRK
jgi:hypothetical protein